MVQGGVAQLVEQRPFKPQVEGSIPSTLTTAEIEFPDAPVAQLVEHRTLNPQVEGSTPSWRTILILKSFFTAMT